MSLSKKTHFLTHNLVIALLSGCSIAVLATIKINRLHERCMRLIYGDKTSSFEELLEQDKSTCTNFSKYLSWFTNSNFAVPNVKSVFHGSKSISYLDPKIWDIVLLELKELTSLNAFENSIQKWQPKNCPCKLCKQYVLNLGFISLPVLPENIENLPFEVFSGKGTR